MPHDEVGQALKALGKDLVEAVDVVHGVHPAVFLTEIHGGAALGQGLTVPQMVVAGHNDALLVEIAGKVVIPPDVLCHAVGYLQNAPKFDLFVGDPEAGVELGLPVGGGKTEMFTICHRICAPSVVYLQYRSAGTALCSACRRRKPSCYRQYTTPE